MSTINRSDIEAVIRLSDNDDRTFYQAMGVYKYAVDADGSPVIEDGKYVKIAANPITFEVYERCYSGGGYRSKSTLRFTEADEAAIVLAITKHRDKAKADGNRGEQVRASRLLKQVINAIDAEFAKRTEQADRAWINKARSLNKKRERVAAGYQPDTFVTRLAENCNRGVVTVEQWITETLDDVLSGKNDNWSRRFGWMHTTEIEANFVIVDGAATMTYTHRKGGWTDKTAVARDTFDEAMVEAMAYLELCGTAHNERTAAEFNEIVAELIEMEQDDALVMQAKVVAEADAMLKETAAA